MSLENLAVGFGQELLLQDESFQIDAGERVCLIGRNGAGKSTLLKIIAGEIQPDAGEVWKQPGLNVAHLAQDLPDTIEASVYDIVAEGLADIGRLMAEYHAVSLAVADDESKLARLESLQQQVDAVDGWSAGERVRQMLLRLDLSADAKVGTLSGGWRRRVALARTLVGDPDLLLLDEPTNHLDLELIEWLENQLLELRCGVLFVTHDRALLTRLATRIVELDRGKLTSWPGDYPSFLVKKAAALEEESRHAALFDKKLAQEETWIRQGIRARRTRNEGRVRALKALRAQRAERREFEGKARLSLDRGIASGKLVVDVENLHFTWEEAQAPVVRDLTMRIMRGDRIGLVGPNGVGKTTLLSLLFGVLKPTSGLIRLGTKLKIAYYDQLRDSLDLEKTVIDVVADGREFVDVHGEPRHVISYLQDFLFSPARARTPVRALSGGERNRLLLASLFAQPANLLVLDEPTNDLDIETLELLEELLVEYDGTIFLVSHDRAFLDNVVTSTLAFEGEGRIQEYVGGYSDWLARSDKQISVEPEYTAQTKPKSSRQKLVTNLGFKQKRELESLPTQIEELEAERDNLVAKLSQPTFYERAAEEQALAHERIATLTNNLDSFYERWDELETLQENIASASAEKDS